MKIMIVRAKEHKKNFKSNEYKIIINRTITIISVTILFKSKVK